jgi:hypothetical protein
VTDLWTGAERRTQSWSPREDEQPWPPVTFVLGMVALFVCAVALLVIDNQRCIAWSERGVTAQEREQRAQACSELAR